MRIGVVMVCFNSGATIGYAIESFLAQTHPDKRLLVVDGGSTDGTQAIVKGFSRSDIRLVSEPDRGLFDAMNKGLRQFEGEAVGFLNSDDAYHSPLALATIDKALCEADIVYGDVRFVADHRTKRAIRIWKAGTCPASGFRYGWMPPHPTFYMRRAVAGRAGEFNLGYRITSDYDYMLRAISLPGTRTRYIPALLVDFKMGGNSTASLAAVIKGNFECLDSRRRHLGHGLLDLALVLKPVRKSFQFLRAFAWRLAPTPSVSAAS